MYSVLCIKYKNKKTTLIENIDPTRLGGQFGEEQPTTIRSLSMFSRHQLPTSDSTEKENQKEKSRHNLSPVEMH